MFRIVPFLLVVLLLVSKAAAAQNEPLEIYASIRPVQYLVERVAGDKSEARVLVRAGQRPETYEPTPRQVAALARADVFFGVGMPLESAWRRQLQSATGRQPEWVDLSQSLDGVDHGDTGHDHVEGGEHVSGHDHHDGHDPHVWLSPVNAKRMVATISETLSRLRPAAAGRYAANAEQLNRELDALHAEIKTIFERAPGKAFLVFHPAWGHFVEQYGLEQLSIETEGKEPGPRSFAELIVRAKQAGVRTVFIEPQHSTRMAETVARALGGEVDILDPLAYDYMNNLREAARAIAGPGS